MNSHLGSFLDNYNKSIDFIIKSSERGADLIVFPEASMFGYPATDLLERSELVKSQLQLVNKLKTKIPKGVGVLVGAFTPNPKKEGKAYNNSAVFLEKGKKPKFFAKQLLPTYDIFDEGRHVEPGSTDKNILKFKGKKILVTVCEDIWAWPKSHFGNRNPYGQNPLKKIPKSKVDLVVNLSASPFTKEKTKKRESVCRQTAKHFNAPVVFVNSVGAQDEIVFDGGSFVMNKAGKIAAKAQHFNEDILVYDKKNDKGFVNSPAKEEVEKLVSALTLGINDFVKKAGLRNVHLGLSGGIDSAVVACLAVNALGPQKVTLISMPGPFNSSESSELARKLSDNLGCDFKEIEINDAYKTLTGTLEFHFDMLKFGLVHENIQARLRGMILMAYSNHQGSMLLNTSNKSEFATGYSTLYGDMCGGLCPIGDLVKSEVVEIANYFNKDHELIPQRIISRPPSAELRPDQKDSDKLPEYSALDPLVVKLCENMKVASTDLEKEVLGMMYKSEFKRWQAPPILKVSNHAFGRGRRFPIAHSAPV